MPIPNRVIFSSLWFFSRNVWRIARLRGSRNRTLWCWRSSSPDGMGSSQEIGWAYWPCTFNATRRITKERSRGLGWSSDNGTVSNTISAVARKTWSHPFEKWAGTSLSNEGCVKWFTFWVQWHCVIPAPTMSSIALESSFWGIRKPAIYKNNRIRTDVLKIMGGRPTSITWFAPWYCKIWSPQRTFGIEALSKILTMAAAWDQG